MGTPGASRAPLGDQVMSQNDFDRFLAVPGMPCGVLVDPLGDLGLALERPWTSRGTKSSEERIKKKHLVHSVGPSRFQLRERKRPGGVECGYTRLNSSVSVQNRCRGESTQK